MEPSLYVPAFLARTYAREHPDLTPAAIELVRDEIALHPETYATEVHAQACLSYARVHANLHSGLSRMEELSDEEYESQRSRLFEQTRLNLFKIAKTDPACIDARLVDILLANVPLDDCINDLMRLELEARGALEESGRGFLSTAPMFWSDAALDAAQNDPLLSTVGNNLLLAANSAPGFSGAPNHSAESAANADDRVLAAAYLTGTDPEVVGWLHTVECLAQGCMVTARYKAAARYARIIMRTQGYPNFAVGTLMLALARLEDEEGFFAAAQSNPAAALQDSPWYLLGRALLLYKLGRRKNARRALKDFAFRCEGGAFFLLNPTYLAPYLPVRPPVKEAWNLTHQAVWEADGIIADTPDFTGWAMSIGGIQEESETFARRYGF